MRSGHRIPTGPATVSETSFAIVANGYGDGPAQALRDYLVERDAGVLEIVHPLTREQEAKHSVAQYEARRLKRRKSISIPVRPPLSFALDPFVPLRIPPVDIWFGFNPLAAARGLVAGRFGRAGSVVLWSVDFVPDRFGLGTPLTRLYDRIDRLACTRANARIELTAMAREARNHRHRLHGRAAEALIVPMGAWLERTPTVPIDGFTRRRVVYLGHLVPRQGVGALLEALALVRSRGGDVVADVIGTGPDESILRERARVLGLADAVCFHGFLSDHRAVEHILASASIAVAPYDPTAANFTRFADPGKIKSYLAAGLPVVLTDVPPNARELARNAGAEIVTYDPVAIADAIARGVSSAPEWQARRSAALAFARHFDWNLLLGDLLSNLGLET